MNDEDCSMKRRREIWDEPSHSTNAGPRFHCNRLYVSALSDLRNTFPEAAISTPCYYEDHTRVGLTITKQYCAHTDASPNSRGHHGAVGLAPGYAEDDQIRYDQEETDDQGDCPMSNGELLFDGRRFLRLTPVGPQC